MKTSALCLVNNSHQQFRRSAPRRLSFLLPLPPSFYFLLPPHPPSRQTAALGQAKQPPPRTIARVSMPPVSLSLMQAAIASCARVQAQRGADVSQGTLDLHRTAQFVVS